MRRLDIPVNITDDELFEEDEGLLMTNQEGVVINVPMTTVKILNDDCKL